MTALPPLLFIDLPTIAHNTSSTRTVTVRVDRITAIGDARDIDYDDLPDNEQGHDARSRVVVDGDGRYLVAMSRTDVLAMMRQARIAADAPPTPRPWEHEGHAPVQHRDGRAPWCETCGWTSPTFGRPAVQITARPR